MKMEEKMIKILEFLQRNVYEVFLILTLILSILSVVFNDEIVSICCLIFAIFLITFNRFKEHDLCKILLKSGCDFIIIY